MGGTFTITASGGTLTRTLKLPLTILEVFLTGSATSGSGSAAITGGSGSYSGYTGTIPNLSGTDASASTGFTLPMTGAKTINTTGGATSTPTPAITAVLDAGSYTANIAEGSVFVVKGTNLSASGFNEFGFPLPTSSNAMQIAFTPASGGSPTLTWSICITKMESTNWRRFSLPWQPATTMSQSLTTVL